MTLDIIGGSYGEVCVDPIWKELYGSGLRAAHALSSFNIDITLYTCIGKENVKELTSIANSIKVKLCAIECQETYTFYYEYPLASPTFALPTKTIIFDSVISQNLLQFGMLEGYSVIDAEKVVYDPQSPGNPQSFWQGASKAKELIWVANFQEVSRFTGSSDLTIIKKFLFDRERVSAAIIKNGTDGAIIIQKEQPDIIIPAFKTNCVWPIGTGDVFSAAFAYNYLCGGKNLADSAIQASLQTAYYTEATVLPLPKVIDQNKYLPFTRSPNTPKNVYLAGPFFNMAQRWLIEQFRNQLLNFGLNVFSPFHDIGLGSAQDVVHLDIAALTQANIVVAIIDGLDAGTIFELGFARAKDIPVLVFTELQESEALTMIVGTGCVIESDFSTIIYKTVWEAYR